MIKNLLQINNNLAIVVFVFVLLVSACSKNQEKTTPATAPAPSAKAAVMLPKPIQKQVSTALLLPSPPVNQFDFSKKKDPFKPFVTLKAEPKNTSEAQIATQRNSLPIHSFDINQFKLIGIITGVRGSQAMVTDPGGKGYVLKVGMTIGKNEGRIVSINSSGVTILEQFKDDNGRVRKENIKLTLPKKQ